MLDEVKHNRMLGSTAQWTAAVRFKESEREDRLFYDPWAETLAGRDGLAWLEKRSADSVIPIVLRTRFFDDVLLGIASRNGIRQIVLIAAGLDTRAFRLNWPEYMRMFELDQIHVLDHKEHILQTAKAKATCERKAIRVDLTAPWEVALQEAGFDTQQPSGWLLEGFLFYLSKENLTSLLDRSLNLAAAGSFIGFDIINSITLTSNLTKQWVEMQKDSGAPWIGTMDNPADFLSSRGWKATLTLLGSPEANYNRWPFPIIPTMIPGMPALWFVIGQKE
jgi:methyltransferase (TIGR00027 family)